MKNDLSKNTGTYLIDEAATVSFAKQQRFERETSNTRIESLHECPNILLFLLTIHH